MSRNVSDPNYSLLTSKDFFGGTDAVRIVIIIYIFLSLILNILNLIVVIRIKLKFILVNYIAMGGLTVNFIHTATYFFQWVIKNDVERYQIKDNEGNVKWEVGGLLVGNPNKFSACTLQGFLLISSSISQDILINGFFYIVNTPVGQEVSNKIGYSLFFGLGICFPIVFTLIYYFLGALGINDEFCYVTKFKYNIVNETVSYSYYDGFQPLVTLVYLIRVINLVFSAILLKNVIDYIKTKNMNKQYIYKSVIIPIIQLFTIGIGVIYRLSNLISTSFSEKISKPYLILNTADGIFFPLAFLLKNGFFTHFSEIMKGEIRPSNAKQEDDKTKELRGDEDDEMETS